MTDIVTRLKSDVEQQTSLIGSVVTLLNGLAQRVRDASANGDEDELDSIADDLENNSTALSQAVTANTFADPQAPSPGLAAGDATATGGATLSPAPTPEQPADTDTTGTDTASDGSQGTTATQLDDGSQGTSE